MAGTSRRRTGELLQAVVQLLWDMTEGVQAKEVLESIPNKMPLTEYELGAWATAPDTPRYKKIIRFATIVLVKAGWLVKAKGYWFLTDEGRTAYTKYADPEQFYREAHRLYKEWKKNRPGIDESGDEEPGEDAEKPSITFEEAEEKAWEDIQAYIKSMNPYEFQELVADLLRVMGYYVTWIAPPGKDRGVDIIAHTDPLGTNAPRIKVQVKRREESTTAEGLRSFLSVLGADDVGLFVSTGGFTADAKEEGRIQERRKVTLLGLEEFFDLWVKHYDKLSQEARHRLPLKPLYFLAPEE